MIEEKYTCGKCNREVIATPEQIIAHDKIDIYSLPPGFVYKDLRSNSLGIVGVGFSGIESGLYSDGTPILTEDGREVMAISTTHGSKQRVVAYEISSGEFLEQPFARNAREIQRSYIRGRRTVPGFMEFGDFREVYAEYHENQCNGNSLHWELLRDLPPEKLFAIFISQSYGVDHKHWNNLSRLRMPEPSLLESASCA